MAAGMRRLHASGLDLSIQRSPESGRHVREPAAVARRAAAKTRAGDVIQLGGVQLKVKQRRGADTGSDRRLPAKASPTGPQPAKANPTGDVGRKRCRRLAGSVGRLADSV